MTMTQKGATFDRAQGGVQVSGLDGVIARLKVFNTRIEDTSPFLHIVAKLFTAMETQRARGHGAAPEFGIPDQWEDDQPSTLAWRKWLGTEKGGVMSSFGFLATSMMAPVYVSVGTKTIDLAINPLNVGANAAHTPDGQPYVHKGMNYASFHQTGAGGNPVRAIVTLTPTFLLEVRNIAREWVDGIKPAGGAEQNPVVVERELTTKTLRKHHLGGNKKGVTGIHDPIYGGGKSSYNQFWSLRGGLGADISGAATSKAQEAQIAALRAQVQNETDPNMA